VRQRVLQIADARGPVAGGGAAGLAADGDGVVHGVDLDVGVEDHAVVGAPRVVVDVAKGGDRPRPRRRSTLPACRSLLRRHQVSSRNLSVFLPSRPTSSGSAGCSMSFM
jgi:hypothetical protein